MQSLLKEDDRPQPHRHTFFTTDAQVPVIFWETDSYTYNEDQVVNNGDPYNYALVNDGCGDGGFIGYGFTKISSDAPLPWQLRRMAISPTTSQLRSLVPGSKRALRW